MRLNLLQYRSAAWTALLWAALSLSGGALLRANDQFYDEIHNSEGQVRPQYQEVYPVYESIQNKARMTFLTGSKKDFQGDNALDPLPRMLTEEEYGTLKRGVE